MERLKPLVTPRTMGAIVRALASDDRRKRLMRRGIKMEFWLSPQPTFTKERVHWSARIAGKWIEGVAGTVLDGVREIEREAARLQ